MTSSESIEKTNECPVCESKISINKIAGLGLSYDQLLVLRQHAKEGTLGQVINIAEIIMRKLEPEKANTEFQINEALTKLSSVARDIYDQYEQKQSRSIEKLAQTSEKEKIEIIKRGEEERKRMTESSLREIVSATKNIERIEKDWLQKYSELNQNVQDIKNKMSGNGMGNVTEKIVIRDLSSAIKTDFFSDEMASKHGTDIMGTVMDNGIDSGRITISVKNTLKWENSFMTQIKDNMRNDGSKLGILVTKMFPSDALNDTMYIPRLEEGKTIIVVKPENVSIAYLAMREVAISLFKTTKFQEAKDHETDEAMRTFSALMTWINGKQFQEWVNYIDQANKETMKTIEKLSNMRSRMNTDIDNVVQFQTSINEKLGHAKSVVGKLRELLNGEGEKIDE